jgi:hypothetical protein
MLSLPLRPRLSHYHPCPRNHAVCLDCLSSHVTRQVPQLADGSDEVVCLHSSGCGRPFDATELQMLPEGVLRQLFNLVHMASRNDDRRGQVGGREPEVKVKLEQNEGQVFLLSDDSDMSARINDAISRSNISLRTHSKLNTLCSLRYYTECWHLGRSHQRRTPRSARIHARLPRPCRFEL